MREGILVKKIFLAVAVLVSIFVKAEAVFATETETTQNDTVVYDLKIGGYREYEVIDDSNEQYIIEIEEITDDSQVFPFNTASFRYTEFKNGTYKISKKRPLQWQASFKIDINKSNIVKAHSPIAIAETGSFKKTSLKIDDSKQATYYLKRKLGLIESDINLRAKLVNNKIVISY